jgi:predicted Zn-dependent protease
LGIASSHLGELDKAEPLLRAGLEKRPFDPVVLYQLGEVLRQQGKTDEATKYQDEHKRVSELQERRKQLEAQYSLKKHLPADLLELAWIYGQLGEFAKAASTLRVYTHLKPADSDGQRELARVCLKLDDQ